MPFLKDLKGDERKQAQERVVKRLNEVFDAHQEAYDRFASFVAKGNTGGVIATLGFLGAMLGKGGGKPEGVVTVLLVFTVGIVGAGAGAFFEVLMHAEIKEAFQRAFKSGADVDAIVAATADPRKYRPLR